MKSFVESLKMCEDFYHACGANDAQVKLAEEKLSLKFSADFVDYLRNFGIASANGHEFTGVINPSRLNVVDVTFEERIQYPMVPLQWYVIEQANIDGIVIWQSSTGEIYQTAPNVEPIKLCDSLSEYLAL